MIWFGRIVRVVCGLLVFSALSFVFRDIRLLDCGSLQAWMGRWGAASPLIFAVVYCLATLGFFPGVLLTLTAGMIFGVWWGTLLAVFSSTLSATLMFSLSRSIIRDSVAARLESRRWFARFREEVEANSIRYVVFVRLIPLFPYNAVNMASGITQVALKDFVIGSFVGMIPGTFAFVYLGEAGCTLADPLSRGDLGLDLLPLDMILTMGLLIILLAALAIAPLILRRRRRR